MQLELINTLSESNIFRSKQYLDKYSDRQNLDMLYMYVLCLYMFGKIDDTKADTIAYSAKTNAFGNYNHFRSAGTDLYMYAHLQNDNKYFNDRMFRKFLNEIPNSFNAYSYFTSLERQLTISNAAIKVAKRNISNWEKIPTRDKKNTIQTLRREITKIAFVSEMIPYLKKAEDTL